MKPSSRVALWRATVGRAIRSRTNATLPGWRTFCLAAWVMLWSGLISGCAPSPPAEPGLPNVVVIVADDLGWKDLSSYGNPNLRTPHIDRLAAEGVRFERAFVAAPSCSSSRAAMMTGQYPHTNGVTGLAHVHLRATLSPLATTLADRLQTTGYETAIAGKWHVAPYLPTSWYGYERRLGSWIDPRIYAMDEILAFVRDGRERPFFLEINLMDTHREDDGEFAFAPGFPLEPSAVTVPPYMQLPDWPEIRLDLAKFYSQAMRMDAMVGQLLETLDQTGLADNTIVVFVSDNGPPYPGNKMTLYDRGIATPLIVRWPGRISAAEVRGAMVSTIDLAPTLLEAVGQPVPREMQGRSFWDVLTGRVEDVHRDVVFAEMTHHRFYVPTRAVRTERWKYIRNFSDSPIGLDQLDAMAWAHRLSEQPNQPWKSPRPPEELYDLVADPHEQRNLIDAPETGADLERMRRLLDAEMRATGDPMQGAAFLRDHDPDAS